MDVVLEDMRQDGMSEKDAMKLDGNELLQTPEREKLKEVFIDVIK